MTNQTNTTDVVIIGAGPVGLFGVFACGMLGLKTHVIDALDAIGGQCTALYPQKPIYDIPAYPSILGGDLVAALSAQATPFHPTYHLGASVTEIAAVSGGGFTVKTTTGTIITTKVVLIACGAGAFGPNKPPLADLAVYEGKSVFYAVHDPHQFRGKRLAIAGGGDSAIDWAIHLADIAAHVSLIHRRDNFRAAPANLKKLDHLVAAGRVTKVIPYQLDRLEGTNGQLTHVIVHDLDQAEHKIEAEALLCFYGLSTDLGILAHMGLTVDGAAIVTNPTTGATSQPGIFAAGDGVTYPNKQKLIVTGFAEISQAAQAIYHHIHPGQELHHVHSTTRGIPS